LIKGQKNTGTKQGVKKKQKRGKQRKKYRKKNDLYTEGESKLSGRWHNHRVGKKSPHRKKQFKKRKNPRNNPLSPERGKGRAKGPPRRGEGYVGKLCCKKCLRGKIRERV